MLIHEIKVRKNGEEKWVSANKWFNYMLKEYSRINYKGKMIDPYEDRVNKFFDNIPKDMLIMWKKAYPNVVDINATLEQARAWLLSNRGKAKKDFKRFCNNWLASSRQDGRSGANDSKRADERVDRQIKNRRKYQADNEVNPASQDDIKNILKKGGWIKDE